MNIDLEVYVVCRVALAQMMLREPGEAKFRKAFNALRQSLVDENEREASSTENLVAASRLPALLRRQI